jgi:phosphoserine aminotransferase
MISFYPGPSKIHDEIPRYVQDAYKLGIMSINHRSEEFVTMSKKTISLLKEKLNIPKNYTILYTTSATECWEIIAQSFITGKSFHFYNGSFGQKWFEYTKRIRTGAEALPFDRESKLNTNKLNVDKEGVICLTQNETSNGTQISNALIRALKKNNPACLIAIDATSSMAGISLDFKAADVWFASVQKCFGLPAGLGLMICSPNAVSHARKVNENDHYNSMPFMLEMIDKWQTPFTPNVLSIYLLMRVLEKCEPIGSVEQKIQKRYEQWELFFSKSTQINFLIKNKAVRSLTVVPVGADEDVITRIKSFAKQEGFLLGEGYGDLKKSTFRIANFPALKPKEINALMRLLKQFN